VNYTRREFIQRVGIAFASLAMARCIRPTGGGDGSVRDRLRRYWAQFDSLAQDAREQNYERSEKALEQFLVDHQAALDELVAAGELDADVAAQVQTAFGAAAYHVWRSNAPITCYEPFLVDYTPTISGQLAQQAEVLAEMAESGDLDMDTVTKVQVSIERDVAFLNLSREDTDALYDELIAAAGDSYAFPPFDELDLEITPEAEKAARFLIELLLAE